jgi:hypothetical protein
MLLCFWLCELEALKVGPPTLTPPLCEPGEPPGEPELPAEPLDESAPAEVPEPLEEPPEPPGEPAALAIDEASLELPVPDGAPFCPPAFDAA